MQIGLDAVRDELKLRAQKKSDPQPTGKTEQLPENQKEFFQKQAQEYREAGRNDLAEKVEQEVQNMHHDQTETAKAFENKGWEQAKQALTAAPQVAPKPTATIHFAGQQHPGQYTRGELWSDVRQNFKLVLLSATFRRCLGSGDYSELWSMVLFVKLWQGIHEGLKKLEGGKDYTMEELLIRHWAYSEDLKQAGRALAEYLKQPKTQQ
jgi:hypothetical protein